MSEDEEPYHKGLFYRVFINGVRNETFLESFSGRRTDTLTQERSSLPPSLIYTPKPKTRKLDICMRGSMKERGKDTRHWLKEREKDTRPSILGLNLYVCLGR